MLTKTISIDYHLVPSFLYTTWHTTFTTSEHYFNNHINLRTSLVPTLLLHALQCTYANYSIYLVEEVRIKKLKKKIERELKNVIGS